MTNNENPSIFSKITSNMFQGWSFGSNTTSIKDTLTRKKPVKDFDCEELLSEFNKCARDIKPDENIEKCKDIVELYKLCVDDLIWHKSVVW